jgi:ribose 5-phosphate isomerase B
VRIALGSDHAGFEAKELLIKALIKDGFTILDQGCFNTDSVDYPDFAKAVGKVVVEKHADGGVLICGTGIGMSIAANKVDGIRAALVTSTEHARLSKEHNNANVICMGARMQTVSEMKNFVDVWTKSKFEAGRHQQRINKIELK